MKDKDGISIMACASMSHKAPLAIIGKAGRPECFSLKPIPIKYNHQVYVVLFDDHMDTTYASVICTDPYASVVCMDPYA